MAITTTPVILYDSGGKVIGPAGGIRALIQFYRPPTALDPAGLVNLAQPVAFGGEATGIAVGSPIAISELTLQLNSVSHNTTGRYTENNNDPTLLRGDPRLNMGTFVQSLGQPLILPGDYCALSVGTKVTSTAAVPVFAPLTRWIIDENSLATAGPNKWTLTVKMDRVNSDPTFNLW